ncbi:hypothetical protein V3H24_23485 [Vibrio parahaemolyticus]|uniref:hypothetical protein n=3 Tax=Vibrio parahaemolyticus TaxID=670 RepID=UPI00111F4E04|nr:hypothetical protein [Vibrio parahaemolyticus]MDF4677357.1 hypothetical protein [Vibrio parahaemolyticus]MDF4701513.1 hypothetical protein [Vibrio parahaemolyticus]TOP24155.1 hypothetical protein CGH20_22850 [Vibrio parahaemolyticus]HCG7655423.1 hypothetical protein [Vibrio parahaemolyticus]
MEHWYRTDEVGEFISSLRMVTKCLDSVSSDIDQWKWLTIALHNSMQGAMVMALSNGNDFRVMPDKLANKCLEAHRKDQAWPKVKMDSFPNLYKKVQSTEIMGFYVQSRALPRCDNRDFHINKLLELRNAFVHFMPKGWSLEVSGLPDICISILKAIQFLCFSSGNINFYEKEQREIVKTELEIALRLSEVMRNQYAN